MNPGDLVAVKREIGLSGTARARRYPLWKNHVMIPPELPGETTGEMHSRDVALVLDSYKGEVKVLTSSGGVGWMWRETLEGVEP